MFYYRNMRKQSISENCRNFLNNFHIVKFFEFFISMTFYAPGLFFRGRYEQTLQRQRNVTEALNSWRDEKKKQTCQISLIIILFEQYKKLPKTKRE